MIHLLSRHPCVTTRLPLMAAVLFGAMVAVSAAPTWAADAMEQQQLVDKAKMTVEAFAADPGVGPATRELKGEAKALFIVPQFLRGAFVFGGAGGSGVLLVRDEKTKKWSEPAADLERIVRVAVRAEEPCLVLQDRSSQRNIGLNDLEPVARASRRIVPVPALASDTRRWRLPSAGSSRIASPRSRSRRPRWAWPHPPRPS